MSLHSTSMQRWTWIPREHFLRTRMLRATARRSLQHSMKPSGKLSLHPTWFPQTLKSAWIWMLSWKVLDFSICLENGRFSLKSAWKWLYGLEKYRHQKVESVSVLFCTFELRKVARFSILSSNLRHCWSSEPCFSQCRLPNQSFFCIKFFVTVYIIEI